MPLLSTTVLCSVPNTGTAKSYAFSLVDAFLFIEHVAAPQETWLRRVQSGVKPIGKYSATVATDRETWLL